MGIGKSIKKATHHVTKPISKVTKGVGNVAKSSVGKVASATKLSDVLSGQKVAKQGDNQDASALLQALLQQQQQA